MLRPLWLWVIGHAITTGKLEAVENWTEVNFTTPRRVTVDAGREAQQNRSDVEAGLKTLSDHFAELGMDIHEEVEKRAQEMKLIEETAQRYGLSPQLLFASFKQETTTPPVTST
jgi:capsid protein